jgi:hypothetical protein
VVQFTAVVEHTLRALFAEYLSGMALQSDSGSAASKPCTYGPSRGDRKISIDYMPACSSKRTSVSDKENKQTSEIEQRIASLMEPLTAAGRSRTLSVELPQEERYAKYRT